MTEEMAAQIQPNQGNSPVVIQGAPNQGNSQAVIQGAPNQGNSPVVIQGAPNPGGFPMVVQGAPAQTNQPTLMCVPGNQREFPVRSLRIFGVIQIVLGLLLGLISVIGIGLDAAAMNCDRYLYYYYSYDYGYSASSYSYYKCSDGWSHALLAFDITCLVCSGWYLLTGLLPICMTNQRKNSWRCLRIAFMVCSIIGAAVFVPTMFSLGVSGSFIRAYSFEKTTVISALMAVLSFIELVVAIVAASYCCCCTPWNDQQQTVVITTTQPGVFTNMPQTQIPVMSYPTNAGQVLDPRAQQYVITSNQQPYQPNFINQQPYQTNFNNQQQYQLSQTGNTAYNNSDAPPAYKE